MMRHRPLAHLRNHEEVNEAVTTKTGYKYSDIHHSVSIQYTVSIEPYSVYSTQYTSKYSVFILGFQTSNFQSTGISKFSV